MARMAKRHLALEPNGKGAVITDLQNERPKGVSAQQARVGVGPAAKVNPTHPVLQGRRAERETPLLCCRDGVYRETPLLCCRDGVQRETPILCYRDGVQRDAPPALQGRRVERCPSCAAGTACREMPILRCRDGV